MKQKIIITAFICGLFLTACDETGSGGGNPVGNGGGTDKPSGGCPMELAQGSPAVVARSAAAIRNACGFSEEEFTTLFKLK